MKGSALVLVLILGHFLPESEERDWSACRGQVFHDCFDYCRKNSDCKGNDFTHCIVQCNNGCGCKEAYVIRNNGGCVRLKVCLEKENGDEEEEIQDKGEIVSTEPAPIENVDPAME